MSWSTTRTIKTPRGEYTPQSDDLKAEILAAMSFAGLRTANVRINGTYIEKPENLPTNSVAALAQDVTVESVEVSPRNTAGGWVS